MSANAVADLFVYGHPLMMVALLPEEAQGVSFDELSCLINFYQGAQKRRFATSRVLPPAGARANAPTDGSDARPSCSLRRAPRRAPLPAGLSNLAPRHLCADCRDRHFVSDMLASHRCRRSRFVHGPVSSTAPGSGSM